MRIGFFRGGRCAHGVFWWIEHRPSLSIQKRQRGSAGAVAGVQLSGGFASAEFAAELAWRRNG
jgi:hypothetical protein